MLKRIRLRVMTVFATAVLTMSVAAALAGEDKPSVKNPDAMFGSRTDKADGSAAMTIGRRLPTEWETKIGTDVSLAAPDAVSASENLLRGGTARSAGVVWGNLTAPVLPTAGFDKASIEARLDAGKDEGKLGATLSRSVPLNETVSVTLQNSYSVKQSLSGVAAAVPATPLPGNTAGPAAAASSPAFGVDETVRLNVHPSGTTFSAAAGASTLDGQWRNTLSVEQTLAGPLKLTTSVEDAGTSAVKRSITAGFKRVW